MSAPVTDLLAERQKRHRNPLHFETAPEALAFALRQVRELQDQAGSALLLDANELSLPLSQLDGVLVACLRLYDRPNHDEETR